MATWLSNLCYGFSPSLYTFSPKWSFYEEGENLWELSNKDMKKML